MINLNGRGSLLNQIFAVRETDEICRVASRKCNFPKKSGVKGSWVDADSRLVRFIDWPTRNWDLTEYIRTLFIMLLFTYYLYCYCIDGYG